MVEGGRSGKETRKKDGIMMLILNRVRELWRSILATSVTPILAVLLEIPSK